MITKSKKLPSTWLELMTAAGPAERTNVAAQCLARYFEELRARGPDVSIGDVRCDEMLRHLSAVREVVLAIPPGHPVFAMDGLEQDWGHETATAVKKYLDMTKAWVPDDGSTSLAESLLRTIWLNPDLTERRSALLEFATAAAKPSYLKNVLGKDATFIRLVAWGLATEEGGSATLSAATALTLQLYSNERSIETRSEYPVLDAIGVALTWCLRGSDKFKDILSFEKAKTLLTKHQSVCLALIEHVEFVKPHKFPYAQIMLHGSQLGADGNARFEGRDHLASLLDWMPAQKSTILWAKSIDLSYRDTLTQIATAMATQESVALPLPFNIAINHTI